MTRKSSFLMINKRTYKMCTSWHLKAEIISILFYLNFAKRIDWHFSCSYNHSMNVIYDSRVKKKIAFNFDDNYSRVYFWSKVKPLESVIIDHCIFFFRILALLYLNCYIIHMSILHWMQTIDSLYHIYTVKHEIWNRSEEWDYKFHFRFFYIDIYASIPHTYVCRHTGIPCEFVIFFFSYTTPL